MNVKDMQIRALMDLLAIAHAMLFDNEFEARLSGDTELAECFDEMQKVLFSDAPEWKAVRAKWRTEPTYQLGVSEIRELVKAQLKANLIARKAAA